MYKVLIVDDFIADRKNIRDILLAFEDFPVEVVGECENGSEALAMIENCLPDIVVSDIEMPICDGFEMAKQIRITYPNVKIIFCSLYDEFEYAKRALYFDSYGYVLKPIDPQELKQCIIKVIASLSDETLQKEQQQELENIKNLLVSYKPVLVENLLRNLVYGASEASEEELWRKIDYLDIRIRRGSYFLILMEIDDFDKVVKGQSVEQQQIFSFKVYEKIREIMNFSEQTVLARLDDSHFNCICSFDINVSEDKARKLLNDYCSKLLQEFKKSDVSLTLSVSDGCSRIVDLNSLHEQCMFLIKHKFSLGKGKAIYSDEIPSYKPNADVNFNSIIKEFRFYFNSGMQKETEEYLDRLFFNVPGNLGELYLKNLCFCIVICVQILLNENNENFGDIFESETLVWEKLLKFETILDARNWIRNIVASAVNHLNNKAVNKNRVMTEEVKKFIERNYVKNFSLEVLAAQLFYSPNYLNRVFKQEVGETIYDYATRYRVEKAKEMLADPRIKFYEVTELLGYSNPGYFSCVFKKLTGLTPKEFRERNIK